MLRLLPVKKLSTQSTSCALGEQPFAQVRAEEAGTAGDQHFGPWGVVRDEGVAGVLGPAVMAGVMGTRVSPTHHRAGNHYPRQGWVVASRHRENRDQSCDLNDDPGDGSILASAMSEKPRRASCPQPPSRQAWNISTPTGGCAVCAARRCSRQMRADRRGIEMALAPEAAPRRAGASAQSRSGPRSQSPIGAPKPVFGRCDERLRARSGRAARWREAVYSRVPSGSSSTAAATSANSTTR